jgi:dsRNA-specific ribonuclease
VNAKDIVEPYDDKVYASETEIKQVTRVTIIVYTLSDIKRFLGLANAMNKNILYIYMGDGLKLKAFSSSKYIVNGVTNTVYHFNKSGKEKPFVFTDFTSNVPMLEIIADESLPSASSDFSDVAKINISRSGLATRVPEIPLLVSEASKLSPDDWIVQVKEKVSSLLAIFVSDPVLRASMVSDSNMNYWARVFTHISYNYVVNYEELEKLGDAMLSASIVDYVFRRDPTLRANEVNNIKSRYASKSFQSAVSEVMGLATYLRHDNTYIDTDMREDLMEAFVGALFRTANSYADGAGYVVVFNFVYSIYKHVEEFDASLNSKTAVDQIFIAAGWGTSNDALAQPNVSSTVVEGGFRVTISLTPKAFQNLTQEGLWTSNSRVIGVGEKRDQKNATAEAYDNAYKTLKDIGVDERYASRKKFMRMLSNAQIGQAKIDAVMAKITGMGFDYIDMKQKKQANMIVDMSLIGFRIEQKTRTRSAENGVILVHYNADPNQPIEQADILPMLIDQLLAK